MTKTYQTYKDSGVQWIGQIPEHWEKSRFKMLHSGTNVGESIDKIYWTEDEKHTVFYTAGVKPIHTDFPNFPVEKFTKEEDVLLARNGTPYVYLPSVHAVYTDHIIRASILPSANRAYISYALAIAISHEAVDSVSLPTWSASLWNAQVLPLPPLSEQQAIAEYLDKKTGKIDESVAALEVQKADLQKYRISVISEAVTRGLDAAVKMKDSGVQWIGQIPEGWKILPIKRFASIQTGNTPSTSESKYFDGDFNWFTPGDFKGQLMLVDSNRKLSHYAVEEGACRVFPAGSVYIIGIGGTLGKVAACSEPASSNQQITVVSPKESMNYKYVAYYLFTKREIFENKANAATLPILSNDAVAAFPTPIPPLSEQQAIAEYLDKKTAKIDESIALIDAQIADLQAYRSAVISEAVTGKVKVSCGE